MDENSWKTWKSNQKIVMDEELVQNVVMDEEVVKTSWWMKNWFRTSWWMKNWFRTRDWWKNIEELRDECQKMIRRLWWICPYSKLVHGTYIAEIQRNLLQITTLNMRSQIPSKHINLVLTNVDHVSSKRETFWFQCMFCEKFKSRRSVEFSSGAGRCILWRVDGQSSRETCRNRQWEFFWIWILEQSRERRPIWHTVLRRTCTSWEEMCVVACAWKLWQSCVSMSPGILWFMQSYSGQAISVHGQTVRCPIHFSIFSPYSTMSRYTRDYGPSVLLVFTGTGLHPRSLTRRTAFRGWSKRCTGSYPSYFDGWSHQWEESKPSDSTRTTRRQLRLSMELRLKSWRAVTGTRDADTENAAGTAQVSRACDSAVECNGEGYLVRSRASSTTERVIFSGTYKKDASKKQGPWTKKQCKPGTLWHAVASEVTEELNRAQKDQDRPARWTGALAKTWPLLRKNSCTAWPHEAASRKYTVLTKCSICSYLHWLRTLP